MIKPIFCLFLGHRLHYQRNALEGGKLFRCERCGLWLWKTPEGWYPLGREG